MSKFLKLAVLALALVVIPAVVAAESHEEPPPTYVWVSFVTAQPGQGDALTGMLMEDAKHYDPLVESGAAIEWGVGIPIVHDGGDSPVRVQWVTFVGWDGADQFMTAFNAHLQAMSEEERKEQGETWAKVVVPGSHRDMINRTVHIGTSEIARPTYIHLDFRTAKPGQANAASAFYKNEVAPVFDKALADGKIQNYGLHQPAVHRSHQTWTHMGWFMSKTLAARDAVDRTWEMAFAEKTEAERKAWMDGLHAVLEPGMAEQIILVVHHKAASGGQEGED